MNVSVSGRARPDLGVLSVEGEGLAVEAGDERVSWLQLDRLVQGRLNTLSAQQLGPGCRVILRLPLGLDYVVWVLALLRAGAVVVPLGGAVPQGHLDRVRRLTGATAEVAEDGALTRLDVADVPRVIGFAPNPDEAYIYFTSGSTGTPKGVVDSRVGLTDRLGWGIDEYFSPDVVRCAARANPTFIDSLTEILGALHAGRTLVVAPPGATNDLGALGRFIADRSVEQVTITPSCLPVLAREPLKPLQSIARWVLSGEPLHPAWARAARRLSPRAEIINSYGSTEVAGDVFFHRIAADAPIPDPVPLGHPAPGVLWRLASEDDHRVGELLIAGSQVGLGYLGDSEGKVPPAFTGVQPETETDVGDRWFATGDLVRRTGSSIEHVGRRDDIRKVRGRRVPLRAIEHLVAGVAGVEEVAVEVIEGDEEPARVVAYVAGAAGCSLSGGFIRSDLDTQLPPHLIPDAFVVMDHLPRTATGKLDRQGLRERPLSRGPLDQRAFSSDLELLIATTIDRCSPGVEPDRFTTFISMGIDSFHAVEIAEVLGRALGLSISAVDLFTWGNIETAARGLLGCEHQMEPTCLRMIQPGRPDRVLVMLPPAMGTGLCYTRLLPHIGGDPTAVLLEQSPRALEVQRDGGLEELGGFFADEIRSEFAGSSATIVGWSFGALVAPHCQHALARLGVPVDNLVLIDPARSRSMLTDPSADWALRRVLDDFGYEAADSAGSLTVEQALALVQAAPGPLREVSRFTLQNWIDTMNTNVRSLAEPFSPPPTVSTLVIRGSRTRADLTYPDWVPLGGGQRGPVATVDVDATHFELLSSDVVADVGRIIREFLGW